MQQQYTKKNCQDEFFSGHELSIQKQYLEEQNMKYKKQKKLQKSLQESHMSSGAEQQFHSIESIRHEKSYSNQYNTIYAMDKLTANSSATEQQRLQDIYNSKQMSKKPKPAYDVTQDQEDAGNENHHEDSDQSHNSGSSSDDDNDSLFQPTSIFEYDIEQPNQMPNSDGNCGDMSLSKGYQLDQSEMDHQSINSIVNEIKSKSWSWPV